MAAFLDVCRFTPAAGGTTDWTYSAAVIGYQSPALAGAVNGRVYKFRAESADLSQWEMCEGAYSSGTGTFVRTTVLFNSSGTGTAAGQSGAGTKITFTTVPQVAVVALKEDLLSIEEANAFTTAQQAQARANLYAAPFDAMAVNGMQINGNVDISQELGTTGIASLANNTDKYLADGWDYEYTNASGTATISGGQVAAASFPAALPGYNFALQFKATAAMAATNGDLLHFRHRAEGNRVARLGWGTANAQPLAIAFQWFSTVSGTSFARVFNNANNRCYYIEFAVTGGGWQWVTLAIPGDTTGTWLKDNGIGLIVDIFANGKHASPIAPGSWGTLANVVQTTNSTNFMGTTNNVVLITGFLLLPGLEFPSSTRAPLIMRPADVEYQRCLRYLYALAPGVAGAEVSAGGMASAIQGYYPIVFPVKMRATPTMTVSTASDWNNNPFQTGTTMQAGTAAQFASMSPFGFRFGLTSTSTGVTQTGVLSILNAGTVNAKIQADARL
jgi:hypothetical protein